MFRFTIISLMVATLALGGCGEVRQEDSGKVVGGILGGVLGSGVGKGSGRTAAIIVGTIAGAMIGGNVGKTMDDTDQMKAQRALETSRTGNAVEWRNPDSGNEYTVTPTHTYTASSGSACRDYTTDAWIDGRKETVTGTACRQDDGTWRSM